jgi:hypothetical protein
MSAAKPYTEEEILWRQSWELVDDGESAWATANVRWLATLDAERAAHAETKAKLAEYVDEKWGDKGMVLHLRARLVSAVGMVRSLLETPESVRAAAERMIKNHEETFR